MPRSERKFRDGDVIFREGDASESAFVLVDGKVALSKAGERGPTQIALLRKGEMFGEMGIIDQGPRSATAQAVGRVLVQVIPRAQFLDELESDTKLAMSVIRKLVQRLRAADEMLVQRTEREAGAVPGPARAGKPVRPGLFARLLGGEAGPRADRIEVRVAPMAGDNGPDLTRAVVAALERRKAVRARILAKGPEAPSGAGVSLPAAMVPSARRLLAESDGDLLIWGALPEMADTVHLHFVSLVEEDDDRPGPFAPSTALPMPVAFEPELGEVLCACALAALAPRSDAKALALREALPEAVEAAIPLARTPPSPLTSRERAAFNVCFGNALAAVGHLRGSTDLYQAAAKAYRAALETLNRRDGAEWALTRMRLGIVLHALAERSGDAATRQTAVTTLRAAIEILDRAEYPREWAAMQNRLGEILYRLDLGASEGDLLKQALTAFQAALQVYSRTETPLRWAGVMNNIGQAAQVMGQQLRDPEILERAVDACRAALDVRTRDRVPNLWAASQNNLGSALFLLGRLTGDVDDLTRAVEAFEAAREVYLAAGSERMVAVTEKNLAHVRRLLDEKRPVRSGPKMWWEDEGPAEPDGADAPARPRARRSGEGEGGS